MCPKLIPIGSASRFVVLLLAMIFPGRFWSMSKAADESVGWILLIVVCIAIGSCTQCDKLDDIDDRLEKIEKRLND